MSVAKMIEQLNEAGDAEQARDQGRPITPLEALIRSRWRTVLAFLREAGLSGSFYDIMRGKKVPREATIEKAAAALGMTPKEFKKLLRKRTASLPPVADPGPVFSPEKALEVFMGKPNIDDVQRAAERVERQETDQSYSVEIKTVGKGLVHLVAHIDNVVPMAEALTILDALSGMRDGGEK